MRTDIESLWVFALASKCKTFTSPNTICLLCLLVLTLAIINLVYWAHPGGPAWGKHKWSNRGSSSGPPAIPGPRGLPVIGSMNVMCGLAHHKIAAMAAACQAKRLMAFSLGETRVIVTCNPDVARELLNSSDFADRPAKESAYRLMFNRAIGFAPYGLYWRSLRRIAATHLFCPKQIKASEAQRVRIASQMVQSIMARAGPSTVVRDVLKAASLNNMMSSVFGGDSFSPGEEELRGLVEEGYGLLGILNWSDHLPRLAEFDFQKVRFRCSQLVPKVNRYVSKIIDHRRRIRAAGDQLQSTHHRAFVDVLLGLQGPDQLSDSDMIAVLWVSSITTVRGS